MANIHFAVATPNCLILEHFNDFADSWVSELVDAAPSVDPVDGCFAAPSAPGLGVRLDHDVCAEHPRTHAGIFLFSEGWERRGEALNGDTAVSARDARGRRRAAGEYAVT